MPSLKPEQLSLEILPIEMNLAESGVIRQVFITVGEARRFVANSARPHPLRAL
jgi:hypothetical protein